MDAIFSRPTSEAEWLRDLAITTDGWIDGGLGVVAYMYDASDVSRFRIRNIESSSRLPQLQASSVTRIAESRPGFLIRLIYRSSDSVLQLSSLLKAPPRALQTHPLVRAHFPYGIEDAIGIRAECASGHGCLLAIPLARGRTLGPNTRVNLRRVAEHLRAGLRLSGLFDGERARVDDADTVRRASARLDYRALGLGTEALRELRGALAALTGPTACSLDEERTLARLNELMQGKWTILWRIDGAGRRLVLARRAQSSEDCDRARLSTRESEIVAYVARGLSNKYIALELGIAPSTVATHVQSALAKLRLRSRAELVTQFGRVAPAR